MGKEEVKMGARFDDVYRAEVAHLQRKQNKAHDRERDELPTPSGARNLVGLALSGGGIRSATFNLGLLQALAKHGVLKRCDYMSTVSGGAYIGSWLTAWIHRSKSFDEVLARLNPDPEPRGQGKEPREIQHLRQYSSYLTPRRGIFSTDLWTIVTTYLSNLALNLIVLTLTLFTLLILPRLHIQSFHLLAGSHNLLFLTLAALLLLVAVTYKLMNISSLVAGSPEEDSPIGTYDRPRLVLTLAILPLLGSSWFMSVWLWNQHDTSPFLWSGLIGVIYFAIWLFSWGIAQVLKQWLGWTPHQLRTIVKRHANLNTLKVLLTAIPAGTIGGFLLFWMVGSGPAKPTEADLVGFACKSIPLILLIYIFADTIHVGMAGRGFSEEVREWRSRLDASILFWMVILGVLFLLTFYAPQQNLLNTALTVLAGTLAAALLLGGVVYLVRTNGLADRTNLLWRIVWTSVASLAFLGLLLVLAVRVPWFLESGINVLPSLGMSGQLFPLLAFMSAVGLAVLFSWRVGINEFSMHAMYRNRLVRCYLGASNRQRHPHQFTDFDPNDDKIALSDLAPVEFSTRRTGPYPIINATLNLTRGDQLAWQQRMATSFILTPLYCGYEVVGDHRREEPSNHSPSSFHLGDMGYCDTREYGGGITLGTAMAISGAAASPNMGYHSSTPLAFLMTVFNVRLGWWLGNPRHAETWKNAGPALGLWWLVRELLGHTNDRSRYVYLSDGGHFENLGVYELLRRRCRYVIASDVTADPSYEFGDLVSLIRKARIDLAIEIEGVDDVSQLRPDRETGHSTHHYQVATIKYPGGDEGVLIYCKASLTGDEPQDVLGFWRRHPLFPHQSTNDQFFTEDQFESYRRLGMHIGKEVSLFFQGKLWGEPLEAMETALDTKVTP